MKKISHISLLQLAFGAVFLALALNVIYLSISGVHFISGKNIRDFATGNGITTRTLYASRGSIYSADNELLAGDIVSYKLVAYLSETRKDIGDVPAYVTDPVAYANALSPILNMPEEDLLEILQSEGQYLVEFGTYGNDLTPATKSKIEALGLSGLELTAQTKRNYRYGDFASYILGFASNNEEEHEIIEGKMGLEAVMEDYLKGKNGTIQYLTDSLGYNLPNGMTNKIDAKNGNDVYLTIDTNVQRDLELQVNNLAQVDTVESVWAAVMEAKTGKILAIATSPSFDPNVKDIETYNDPFINTPHEVGSVMKPFVYLTAYDQGVDLNQTFMSGSFDVGDGGQYISDWNLSGWGTMSLNDGLIRSSNTAIATILTNYVSKETLRDKYYKLGFFQDTTVSGLQSQAGLDNMDGSLRDFISAGFGQSSSWTALEMLKAYSVFANDGCTVDPYVVDYVLDSETKSVVQKTETKKSDKIFSTEAIEHVKSLMSEVINNPEKGSGTAFKMDDIHLFGKTGTGELIENGAYASGKYTYSLAGLAPYDDPEIIVFTGMRSRDVTEARFVAQPELVKTMVRSALSSLNQKKTGTTNQSTLEFTLNNFTNQSVDYARSMVEYNKASAEVIGDGQTIIDQLPKGGQKIAVNSKVFLLTDGSSITMPNMSGWSRKDVSSFCSLTNMNIQFNGSGSVTSQNIPEGTPISSDMEISVNAT